MTGPNVHRAGVNASLTLLLAIALLCGLTACERPTWEAADNTLNDLGVAQMGRFEYAAAHATFTKLVTQAPDWHEARINLAIATLNRQQDGDEKRALALASEVLDQDPTQVRALYLSGLVHLYVGEPELATAFFTRATDADPTDAYSAYFLGQSRLQATDYEGAARWLLQAVALDPYLRSAYWAGSQSLRRLGRNDEATRLLEDYQRFANNPAARVAGFSYKKMGPKADAQSITTPVPDKPAVRPPGALFATAQVFLQQALDAPQASAADVTGDGRADLYVTDGSSSFLFAATANPGDAHTSGFEPIEHPLTTLASGRTAAWGDVNDDGTLDVVFCGETTSEIRYQSPGVNNPGRWDEQVLLDHPCRALALFDADHDGDLDIFVTGPAGNELFSNNRDGTFRKLAEAFGLQGSAGRQVLVADLDSDRDADILVINETPPHNIWQNDRTWRYQAFDGYADLLSRPLRAVTVADADADGQVELYGADDHGVFAWQNPGATGRLILDAVKPSALAATDWDGDGQPELLVVESGSIRLVTGLTGTPATTIQVDGAAHTYALPMVLDAKSGPGLAVLDSGGGRWYAPGTGRFDFLTITPSGRSESDQMRSNASGIGTRLKVRVGTQWRVMSALDNHSGGGQSLTPVSIGLSGAPFADYVALEWTDGVSQTEIKLAAGAHQIVETQRQLASCPVVFAWNGHKFEFLTDVLGVGGLGFFVAPGETAPPRPFERFLLPPDSLQPLAGRYQVKLTEPMEENAYLDTASLLVYDVPAGWQLVLDERMGTGGPEVTGRPITFREVHVPASVTTATGLDVTTQTRTADLKAAPPGATDRRFVGLLAEPQVLTLTFDSNLPLTNAVLVADGWVEYGYSQTVFAAWQAGISYDPPTLEAQNADGHWKVVAEHFGYPAGMPRKMTLPLGALGPGTVALRLTSNMEIYWDRLVIVREEHLPDLATQVLRPATARVARTGFASRTTGPQKVPDYNYNQRTPYWDTKNLRGFYTAPGDVSELIAREDGALAIIGGGEEIHLEFPAATTAPAGTHRYLALEFRGWAKDMDLYTADGETVGPLPEPPGLSAADRASRNVLHARYNVRYQEGL